VHDTTVSRRPCRNRGSQVHGADHGVKSRAAGAFVRPRSGQSRRAEPRDRLRSLGRHPRPVLSPLRGAPAGNWALIAEVVARYRVPDHRVAIGGVSAGGSGAVRYAQYCALGKCSARTAPVAVASVDAPLDYERFWNSQALSVKRGFPKTPLGESRAILSAMREKLGGSPTEARETYKRFSALLVKEPDGSNAKLLRQTTVGLYTEPDFAWSIDNFNVDAYTMNILDQTAMILQLRVLGNERAELITTTGKGFDTSPHHANVRFGASRSHRRPQRPSATGLRHDGRA
jgi:hypothetical protein